MCIRDSAIPSLQPDSADSKFLKCPGTLCANLPETTDCAKIGSVAVTQAATSKLSENDNPGIKIHTNKPVISQPAVITGTKSIVTDNQCLSIYFFGNSTATAKI